MAERGFEMDKIFGQILECITEFCEKIPGEGEEIQYLEEAQKIHELYEEAEKALYEEDGEGLYSIYAQINALV